MKKSPRVAGKGKKPAPANTIKHDTTHVARNKPVSSGFPVIGAGGAVGGPEAFSRLLEHLPPNSGTAYIYTQPFSPDYENSLPQFLQRKTKIPVAYIKNNMLVQKDHVYIVPFNQQVSFEAGKMKLRKTAGGKADHPVDQLFTSLATAYGPNSIGIVLSGMGNDGTLGLLAIKAEGGISFAQDDTAGDSGMARHAIEMDCVDFVLPPAKIAKELLSFVRHPYSLVSLEDLFPGRKKELQKLHQLIYNNCGIDFLQYKKTTIQRRILRRMALSRIRDIKGYIQLLNKNKQETDALCQDLLIAVTNFFRDGPLYEVLSKKILPLLLADKSSKDPIRVWIPGCASGEEAVSFAITLVEYLGTKAISTPIQIFATDVNEKLIERARKGIYSKASLQQVSAQRLRRFFVDFNSEYQVIKAIRDMCIFAPHNLLKDPPFSKMDLVSCQNLLIYLEPSAQYKIMHAFHYALKPKGFLLLGKSETIGNATDLFKQLDRQHKIYARRMVNAPLRFNFSQHIAFSGDEAPKATGKSLSLLNTPDPEKESDKLLLSRYVPASVLVNKDFEIIRFRGNTSLYLDPASGKASLHLLKMVKEELIFDLRMVIQAARKENRIAYKEGIPLFTPGGQKEINIEVIPIKGGGKEPLYLIIFKDNVIPDASRLRHEKVAGKKTPGIEKKIGQLEIRLKEARESIRIITEEAETTREELQSSNEEVLSSNEELQSINEELETSKEELQSANEELITINEELQLRNTDLKEAGDYAKVIIETMHESLLMLSGNLKVRIANKGFYKTFGVTPEQTMGRYLFELGNNNWNIPELRKQLELVQERDIPFSNFEVTHSFPGIGQKTMLLNAHKFPLKEENETMILLAIQDITEQKELEGHLKDSEERLRLLVENASDIITVFDPDGNIKYESPAIELVLGYKPEERIGRNINTDLIVHPDDSRIKMGLLKKSVSRPNENIYGEFRLRHKDGSYRTIGAIFRNLLGNKKINGIIANYRDISERKALEQQKDEFIGIASHELKTPVTSIKAYAQILEDVFVKANDTASAGLLAKMNTQIDRLTTLIVDLLDFTRIEGGKLKFREEEYEINDLVLEITEEMQRASVQHKIQTKLGKPARLTGDRYRTGQVLTNFLNNAIKYSPRADKIIVTSKVESNHVRVCVRDFGIGIEPHLLSKVFDRFFRVTEPSFNTFPGLGLGLYIAGEFIRRQHGTIAAESIKGKGSTFCFTLPLNQE